jgi:hypothetical protein
VSNAPPAALLVSSVLVALFAALFFYASIVPAPARVPGPLDRSRFMAEEENAIRARFHDPESVRFRNNAVSIDHVDPAEHHSHLSNVKQADPIAAAHPAAEKVPIVCGQINFRNSTNGYVGYRYFASGWTIPAFDDTSSIEEMNAVWREYCDHAVSSSHSTAAS